ncbi:unnamed protein product [Effrenium voratum]|uniref:STAS domain-containing protein n=1 Tax=Effrenium voratum TaxID=2562239 RepID=A0AA36HXE8_9DINO|nr:unnamed protein product [Effrenium voratum]
MGGDKESLSLATLASAAFGVLGLGMILFGALVAWAHILPVERDTGLTLLGIGVFLYFFHVLEALCGSKTSKYLSWVLSETQFQDYVKELQEARPLIRWSIQNYHYEEHRSRDKDGRERVERKRVNTHSAVGQYDINGFADETLSPEQTIAMFHLMYDGEQEDLEASKKKPISRLFLLCAMPLEYHPIDDQEESRLSNCRERFYSDNTTDTHQDKDSNDLIGCPYKSHVMVILKEGTDNSRARPWWMTYCVYVVCTLFLLSVPYRYFFFSQCTKISWEVLKHFSHKPQDAWGEEPKHSRAQRTDAASKAFRKVKRETPVQGAHGKLPKAWHEVEEEDVGPPVQVPVGVPSYWKNRDLGKDFDEKISLSVDERGKMQSLLDATFKNKATRDRKDGDMPSRLVVTQVIRMEDSKMWRRFEQKRAELAVKGRPKLMEEMPGSGGFKTSNAGMELTSDLNEPLAPLHEAYLFHGSCPGGALGIGENGFDMSRVGSNVGTMFGAGAYMAEASSKSDEYSSEDPVGLFAGKRALLLCRTLLGNMFYITESNIPRIEDALATGRFQAVLGDREAVVDTYREFVVFDDAQIYPAEVWILGAAYLYFASMRQLVQALENFSSQRHVAYQSPKRAEKDEELPEFGFSHAVSCEARLSPEYIIIDLDVVRQMESTAVSAFQEILSVAKEQACVLILARPDPCVLQQMENFQLPLRRLHEAPVPLPEDELGGDALLVAETLDQALEFVEESFLQAYQPAPGQCRGHDHSEIRRRLASFVGPSLALHGVFLDFHVWLDGYFPSYHPQIFEHLAPFLEIRKLQEREVLYRAPPFRSLQRGGAWMCEAEKGKEPPLVWLLQGGADHIWNPNSETEQSVRAFEDMYRLSPGSAFEKARIVEKRGSWCAGPFSTARAFLAGSAHPGTLISTDASTVAILRQQAFEELPGHLRRIVTAPRSSEFSELVLGRRQREKKKQNIRRTWALQGADQGQGGMREVVVMKGLVAQNQFLQKELQEMKVLEERIFLETKVRDIQPVWENLKGQVELMEQNLVALGSDGSEVNILKEYEVLGMPERGSCPTGRLIFRLFKR